jgi:hypothetical protein
MVAPAAADSPGSPFLIPDALPIASHRARCETATPRPGVKIRASMAPVRLGRGGPAGFRDAPARSVSVGMEMPRRPWQIAIQQARGAP